ncbi:hypothetical protein VUR80DRAFT_9852 [Thermomyces stellatus]
MADNEPKDFSASEMRFIAAFFANTKTKPEVDRDKVATDASLKDARCARGRLRRIMAKQVTTRAPRKKAGKKTEGGNEDECERVKSEVKGEDTSGAWGRA